MDAHLFNLPVLATICRNSVLTIQDARSRTGRSQTGISTRACGMHVCSVALKVQLDTFQSTSPAQQTGFSPWTRREMTRLTSKQPSQLLLALCENAKNEKVLQGQ